MTISTLPYAFFVLSILSTPWNSVIILSLRLADIFLLFAVFMSALFLRISKPLITALFMIFFIILLSMVLNMPATQNIFPERFVFIYKYSVPLLTAIVFIATTRSEERLKFLEKSLMVTYFTLVAWAYAYVLAVGSGSLIGVSRPSFPGSTDFQLSDAHLYSNYLAMGLIFYLLHIRVRYNNGFLLSSSICFVSLGAVFVTGSRNGVFLLMLSGLVWILFHLFSQKVLLIRKSIVKTTFFLLLLILAGLWFFSLNLDFFQHLVVRSFDFNFFEDASVGSRIRKLEIGLNDWLGGSILFGAGILNASLIWYDSGIAILLVHIGLVGSLLVLGGLFWFARGVVKMGLYSSAVRSTLILLLFYIVGCGITEFALVTRSALPAVLFILIPVFSRQIQVNGDYFLSR